MHLDREDRKFARQKARLLEELHNKGIRDERVLAAINHVPRHLFVEHAMIHRAYEDEALPIGLQQTISQPFTVAYQTELLNPQKNERVLEIGTGSGYQAAILCQMGARVFSIERHEALHRRAKEKLRELNYRVTTKHGDGTLGWATFAPFDKILVTAGARGVPEAILQQLREPEGDKPGGRLVIPIGDDDGQTMCRITRTGPDSFHYEELNTFRFVPLIGEGRLLQ